MAEGTSRNSASAVLTNLVRLMPYFEPLYKDIHAHPELSMHKSRMAGIAADGLREAGYEVTAGVGKTGPTPIGVFDCLYGVTAGGTCGDLTPVPIHSPGC